MVNNAKARDRLRTAAEASNGSAAIVTIPAGGAAPPAVPPPLLALLDGGASRVTVTVGNVELVASRVSPAVVDVR
jgi:hypothetical protein